MTMKQMFSPRLSAPFVALAAALAAVAGGTPMGQSYPEFDFRHVEEVRAWQRAHDIAALEPVREGMLIRISGSDPYAIGPARDYPEGQPLWLSIRLESDQGGTGQVFYFQRAATEKDSVRFPVRAGGWQQVRVPLPPLGRGYHLRLDPPGDGGTATIAWIHTEPRILLGAPQWPRPDAPRLGSAPLALRSGELELRHARDQGGGLVLSVAGQPTAAGFTRPLIGYLHSGQPRWLDLARKARVTAAEGKGGLRVTTTAHDGDGGAWEIAQRFAPATPPGAFDVETTVQVDRDRAVIFLPMFMLLPGAGSFGERKAQGLFAGLEYLADEPSSSEADLVGPGSRHQVPDSLKITFPLVAIQADGRYVGLIWQRSPRFSALFDSPDRIFHSGGHVMGVIFPGSDGSNREEGSLLPYAAETLRANTPLSLHATLIGGRGESVVPAVQQYVTRRGLPPVPRINRSSYLELPAAGWLDSAIRDGDLYRHAYPGGFTPGPAADAAVFMEWLAPAAKEPALSGRLRAAASAAIARVPPAGYNASGVSHNRDPVGSLIFGHVAENAGQARQTGRELLGRFEPNGSILYHPSPGGMDFGRTHYARDANGLTAQVVHSLLQAAAVSGDPELIREGLRLLRALDKFNNTVPRGAQTWEVPLHTPDILASAHLLHAYTLGYELTGDSHLLDRARYWAWTGVPFVYLDPSTKPVGPYASIAVLGATHWEAPVWIGLPVQWCGLVYADALYRFQRFDKSGPWKQLADGITASGIQQTWPIGSNAQRQGLLPDSFQLRPQIRNDAAINPGTVQAVAARLLNLPAIYDFHAFRGSGLLVHAPGAITDASETRERAAFTVHPWLDRACYFLGAGVKRAPQLRLNGRDTPLSAQEFDAAHGWLIVKVEGKSKVEIAATSK